MTDVAILMRLLFFCFEGLALKGGKSILRMSGDFAEYNFYVRIPREPESGPQTNNAPAEPGSFRFHRCFLA
jgi:hypothetical protein